jgi:site-specific recombinase XerD
MSDPVPSIKERFVNDMALRGFSPRTQESYLWSLNQLIKYHKGISPQELDEDDVRAYLLYIKNDKKYADATLRIVYSGLKAFYQKTLQRDWPTLLLLRAGRHGRLPTVLTLEEVGRIVRCAVPLRNQVFLYTVYSCGLRLNEALSLEVGDIDRKRMMVHVHRGKGARDRYVPLPGRTLAALEHYWRIHRHERLLFPSPGRGGKVGSAKASLPMPDTTVSGAMRRAVKRAEIQKKHVSIHTLRHCYATHLLEAGVALPTIQRYLGHTSIETTLVYVHLTTAGQKDAREKINAVMAGV